MNHLKRITTLLLIIGFIFAFTAQAGVIINYPKFIALSSSTGKPLVGGKLYTYINGTTTSKATYTTKACTVANANPVVLDSRGEATVYGIGTYTFVLKTPTGTTIWTLDDIQGLPDVGTNYYYPDSTEADQGAVGLGASAKAFMDLITTKNAGIFLKQDSAVSGTTYTFSTSLTFPANVELYFDKGAIMNIASGVTVTIYSPANLKSVIPNQRIKAGSGALIYTVPYGIKYNVWDGSDLSQSSLSSGFDLIPSGDTTYNIGSETYKWNKGYFHNLQLESGVSINNISTDGTLSGNTDTVVPTEKAIRTYVDAHTVPQYFKQNLRIYGPSSGTSLTQVQIQATEIVLTNTNGEKILLSGVSEIGDINSSVTGLVSGTSAASTTYYLYLNRYYSGTTTFVKFSTSGTTVTTLPPNTYSRLVGEVYNNAAKKFSVMTRLDDRVTFLDPLTIFANTTLNQADGFKTFALPAPLSTLTATTYNVQAIDLEANCVAVAALPTQMTISGTTNPTTQEWVAMVPSGANLDTYGGIVGTDKNIRFLMPYNGITNVYVTLARTGSVASQGLYVWGYVLPR